MTLKADLEFECAKIFSSPWEKTDGTVVPNTEDLKLSNHGRNLDVAVLYADLADSTVMVDNCGADFAAEVYKTFLYCAARIIRSNSGDITAYDGDRVMAVFVGDRKCSIAARTALEIKWAVNNIVQAKLTATYAKSKFVVKHVCGIDTTKVLVARTGIRGTNDLVWVGRSANYAAKLSALPHGVSTYITAEVYKKLDAESKYASGTTDMWTAFKWTEFDDRIIYGSNYTWAIA